MHSDAPVSGGELIQGLSGAATLINDRVVKVNGAKVLPTALTPAGIRGLGPVDMDRYRAVWMKTHGYFSLNMAASPRLLVPLHVVRQADLGQPVSAADGGLRGRRDDLSEAHIQTRPHLVRR